MGIKGIYGEIGPGERISLSKIAIEKLEQSNRPLRVAIDVSIWNFQTQAGQGGSNPAIRTFYYRLLKLLSVQIQPLFVFDGPNKPPFKRGKKTGNGGAMVPNFMTKQLLKLFGFPLHIAPGEAEAECALLQKEGIVDAVLSEDVDTLMFGCGVTFRNWSSEGTKGNKSPTHVSVYNSKATKEGKSGLDREGMILVALMSGGDYMTEGIPGAGIKVACEAARAGYGKSLCQIPRSDTAALEAWRADLAHELRTNESKYFRIKRKALQIPADFPNREVLGYYTHPVVSSANKVQKLREEIVWDGEVDIPGLRLFVAEAFEWTNKIGAIKFVRGLAPVLLVQKLRLRGDRRDSGYGDVILTALNELELVRSICGQRTHFSTDGIPELRVVYHPLDIVRLDLDSEPDDSGDYSRDGLAPSNDDDQVEAYASDEQSRSASPAKRGPSTYDPSQPDKLWLPQTIAKLGIPLKVEDYEESLRNPKKVTRQKAAPKNALKGGMQRGDIEQFIRISKPATTGLQASQPLTKVSIPASQSTLPPVFLAPSLERLSASQLTSSQVTRSSKISARDSTGSTKAKRMVKPKSRKTKARISTGANENPWTIAHPASSPHSAPRITKELSQSSKPSSSFSFTGTQNNAINLVSSSPISHRSPLPPVPATKTPRKHSHSPTPPSSRGSDGNEAVEPELPPLPSTVTRTRGTRNVSKQLCPSSQSDRPSQRKRPTRKLSRSAESNEVERRSSVQSQPEEAFSSPLPEIFDQNADFPASRPSAKSITAALPSPYLNVDNDTPSKPKPPREIIDIPSSPPVPEYPAPQPATNIRQVGKAVKKLLMIRESVGGWQDLDEDNLEAMQRGRKPRRAYRESQVEILDLRGD